jgi:hypothetical protein
MRTESSAPIIVRAHTAWRELWVDVLLLVIGCSFPVISFVIDMRLSQRDWFQRSGAVTVLFAALVGYRSLAKHYRKLYLTQNSSENRYGHHATNRGSTMQRWPCPWLAPRSGAMEISYSEMANTVLSPTVGCCEVDVDFMKQLSGVATLAPVYPPSRARSGSTPPRLAV